MQNESQISNFDFELFAEYRKDYEQPHVCSFCGADIPSIETYEQTIGTFAGVWIRYIKCFTCVATPEWHQPNIVDQELAEHETYVIYDEDE